MSSTTYEDSVEGRDVVARLQYGWISSATERSNVEGRFTDNLTIWAHYGVSNPNLLCWLGRFLVFTTVWLKVESSCFKSGLWVWLIVGLRATGLVFLCTGESDNSFRGTHSLLPLCSAPCEIPRGPTTCGEASAVGESTSALPPRRIAVDTGTTESVLTVAYITPLDPRLLRQCDVRAVYCNIRPRRALIRRS